MIQITNKFNNAHLASICLYCYLVQSQRSHFLIQQNLCPTLQSFYDGKDSVVVHFLILIKKFIKCTLWNLGGTLKRTINLMFRNFLSIGSRFKRFTKWEHLRSCFLAIVTSFGSNKLINIQIKKIF